MVRLASEDDLPSIQRIAKQHLRRIGPIGKLTLLGALKRHTLLVEEVHGHVVGFAHFCPRSDGWHDLPELAIDQAFQHGGHGQALLDAVPRPLRLKANHDNFSAIRFYLKNHLVPVDLIQGRKESFLVFENGDSASRPALPEAVVWAARQAPRPVLTPIGWPVHALPA
jgi:ribosomal protein S18 acetylase RimI-like enzyme